MVLALVAALVERLMAELLIGRPHPGFLLLAVIAVGMVRSTRAGVALAFGGGLFLDAFGPPLGRQALALVLASVVIFVKHTDIARKTVIAPVVAAVLGTVIYWTVLGIADSAMGLAVPWLHVGLRWVLPSLVVNALLAWPAFNLVDKLSVRTGPRLTVR